MVTQKVVKSREEILKLEGLRKQSENEFSRAVSKIAVEENYHPAGYGFFNPQILLEENAVTWERFESC